MKLFRKWGGVWLISYLYLFFPNTLKTPLKHPSTPFQTPFKIISFFAKKNGLKKIGTSQKGGSPSYEVISQKIFNLSENGFPYHPVNIIHPPNILIVSGLWNAGLWEERASDCSWLDYWLGREPGWILFKYLCSASLKYFSFQMFIFMVTFKKCSLFRPSLPLKGKSWRRQKHFYRKRRTGCSVL